MLAAQSDYDQHETVLRRNRRELLSSPTRPSTIMAVNLYHGGHHPQHLHALVEYWSRREGSGELHLVISEAYEREHPSLLAAVTRAPRAHAHLVHVPPQLLHRRFGLVASDRLHRQVVRTWAAQLDVDHVLLMYFDHVQLALGYDLRFPRPIGISGIYFRPTLHYGATVNANRSVREWVTATRKRVLLSRALRNPHLRHLFCFDPYAVAYLSTLRAEVDAVVLPEPLDEPRGTKEAALLRDIPPGRRVLLLFGSLDERKGVGTALDALSALTDAEQELFALVLAGRIMGPDRPHLLERIERFKATTRVHVVIEDRFLDEEEIQPLVRACDLVLLTYLHHVGSSGVLVRAARAGVPVLASDYGLLGIQVVENRLGATVDASSPMAIAAVLGEWLSNSRRIPFDAARADEFAAANTSDAFARTIFDSITSRSS